MSDPKCPFSIVQAAGACSCPRAQEVVRRGGSEYDCTSSTSYEQCRSLVQHLNAKALPALGCEDDLTLTPKSIYERILLGGLQGLRMAADPSDNAMESGDIWAVVESALQRHGDAAAIPQEEFLPVIEVCRIRKRRRKGH